MDVSMYPSMYLSFYSCHVVHDSSRLFLCLLLCVRRQSYFVYLFCFPACLLSICQSIYLSIYRSNYLCIYLSIYVFNRPIDRFICPSVYCLSFCLFVFLSVYV